MEKVRAAVSGLDVGELERKREAESKQRLPVNISVALSSRRKAEKTEREKYEALVQESGNH